MKQKTIVLIILIFIASGSSVVVLSNDGYLNKKKVESKVLATEEKAPSTPIVLASVSTEVKKPTITKTTTAVKKAPTKKVVPKKKKAVAKKKSVNLNPPVFTPATAPYSAKKR